MASQQQEEEDLLLEIFRRLRNKAIAKAKANIKSGNEMLRRPASKRQYARKCNKEPEGELSPKANRKETVGNGEAVDVNIVAYANRGLPIPKKKRSALIEKDDNQEYEPDNMLETDITDRDFEDEEKPQKKKARGNKMTKKSREPSPPQDTSEVMKQTITELGGKTPVWLFEKTLYKSDTNPHLARIFMTSQTLKDLLTPAERRKHWILQGRDDTRSNKNKEERKNYTVTLVEPDGKTSEIDFKIWASLSNKDNKDRPVEGEGQLALTGTKWKELVGKYKMEAGTKLQFWCFRNAVSNELCFAMNNKV